MKILLIFVSILVANVRGVCCDLQKSLERNQDCTTPYQEQAKCISVYECKEIMNDIRSGDKNRLDFIKQSQCGDDGTPLVCCGSKSYRKRDLTNRKRDVAAKSGKIPISISNLTICGQAPGTPRIAGGEVTYREEFPWMAALEYINKLDKDDAAIRCGGTLITNRYVLTAAHCIYDLNFDLIRVWLGDWDITEDPDCDPPDYRDCSYVQKIKIEKKTVHPLYRRKTFRNDIGLLRLETEVKYTDYIFPICLPTQDQPVPKASTRLTVAGWGATENGTQSNVKQKVALPVVRNEMCNSPQLVTNVNQICAGGETGKDSCRGDSGGPLMRYQENNGPIQWFQEGIVSYGKECGLKFPAVYTRVSRYIEWIIDVMKQDDS